MIVNIDAEKIEALASAGRYWWARPDGECYATGEREGTDEGDVFLIDASEVWLSQWGGDWSAIEERFVKMLEKINGEG